MRSPALLGEVAGVDHVERALGGDPGVEAEEQDWAHEADPEHERAPTGSRPRATASRRPAGTPRRRRPRRSARPRSGPGRRGRRAAPPPAGRARAPPSRQRTTNSASAADEAEEEGLRHRRGQQVEPSGVQDGHRHRHRARPRVAGAPGRGVPEGGHPGDEEDGAQEAGEEARAVQAVALGREHVEDVGQGQPDRAELRPSRGQAVEDAPGHEEVGLGVEVQEVGAAGEDHRPGQGGDDDGDREHSGRGSPAAGGPALSGRRPILVRPGARFSMRDTGVILLVSPAAQRRPRVPRRSRMKLRSPHGGRFPRPRPHLAPGRLRRGRHAQQPPAALRARAQRGPDRAAAAFAHPARPGELLPHRPRHPDTDCPRSGPHFQAQVEQAIDMVLRAEAARSSRTIPLGKQGAQPGPALRGRDREPRPPWGSAPTSTAKRSRSRAATP